MVEVMGEARQVPHHKKKIAFLFSAMRHFAQELREAGIRVIYKTLPETTGKIGFTDCLLEVLNTQSYEKHKHPHKHTQARTYTHTAINTNTNTTHKHT